MSSWAKPICVFTSFSWAPDNKVAQCHQCILKRSTKQTHQQVGNFCLAWDDLPSAKPERLPQVLQAHGGEGAVGVLALVGGGVHQVLEEVGLEHLGSTGRTM